jgi:DNA invertase Pin-like site-specific DNA recombinase
MSLQAQESRIRAWADAVGAIVVEVVTDAGVSGSKPLAHRAGGSRVAALLGGRRPDADAVAILRLDRLGRDAAESLALLKRFRTSKVGLVSVADRLDLGTPQGRAMASMTAVFAELERDLIRQRTADALSQLRSEGRVFGNAPYGWQAQDGRLVADKSEQKVLARIVKLREQGKAYNKIAATLNDEQIPTKRGRRWESATVRSVVLSAEKMATAA